MLPGYKLNLHANFYMGLGLCPLLEDLELYRYGFSYIEPPVQQAATFRDGTGIVIYKDLDKTCASLARFSKQDAETFRELWHTYCDEMRPLLVSLLYNAPLPREQLVDRLSGPQAKELLSHAQHDLFSVVRKHFVDERIRTLFTSYMHVITTENVPGAGIVFPAIFANIASFTLPVGGAVSLPLALARVVEAGGGEIITDADVREITVTNGRATGVKLDDGRTIDGSKFVASAIDFPTTVQMAGEELFPRAGARKGESLALGQPQPGHPASRAQKPAGLSRRRIRSRHCARLQHLLRHGPHRRRGELLRGLRGEEIPQGPDGQRRLQQPVRPKLCAGRQACRVLVAVRALFGRRLTAEWERNRADYTQRVLDYWRIYASNLEGDNLLGTYLFTPLDVEKLNANMRQGAVRMGAYVPNQLGINRPHPLMPGSRTPVEGLYLCGSSSGNGGGVNGAPGYIAANAIVDDLRLKRRWTPVPAPEWKH